MTIKSTKTAKKPSPKKASVVAVKPTFQYVRVRNVAQPNTATDGSAGIDFFVPNDIDRQLTIQPNSNMSIPTGIHVKFSKGYALIAFNKSGVASKKNLVLGACVVDSDYQGEIFVDIHNIGRIEQTILPGEKLTQFLLLPIASMSQQELNSLSELYGGITTQRGDGARGSTGEFAIIVESNNVTA